MINKADYLKWTSDPVTHYFFKLITDAKKEISTVLEKGMILNDDHLDRKYAYHVGYIEALILYEKLSRGKIGH